MMVKRQAEDPQINLTPLIDVVFVILIMFILIAPMLDTDRIELASGSSVKEMKETNEKSVIAIQVQKDNSISINGQKVKLESLVEHLRKLKKQYPFAHPQLFQDQKAFFGTYQRVKNAAEEAGFDHLDLILKPS